MSIFGRREIKQLKSEVEKLNFELELIKEQELSMKELQRTVKALKLETAQLQDHHNSLIDKIRTYKKEENQKLESLKQLDSKISSLAEVKTGIQENILSTTTKLNELEALVELNQSKLTEIEDQKKILEEQKRIREEIERGRKKIGDLIEEEDHIKGRINQKQTEISSIEKKLADLLQKERNYSEKTNLQEVKLRKLDEHLRNLDQQLNSKNRDLAETVSNLEIHKQETDQLKQEYQDVQAHRSELKISLEKLESEEKAKYGILKNLTIKIKAFEQHAQKLYANLTQKSDQLKDVTGELVKASDSLTLRQEELESVNNLIVSNGDKLNQLKSEVTDLEKKKNQVLVNYTEMQNLKFEYDKLVENHSKLSELISLLQQRRTEIEQGNTELETRFMKVFQKLNKELNDINKKRNVLEQVLLKKDKDLDDKDQMLFEKLAALEESERILNIRQVEIESTDQVLNSTREQREYLWNELQKLEDEAIERRGVNEDLRLETDLLFKKKSVIEKNFQDLLNTMNLNYSKLRERNTGFQKEFQHYEDEFDVIRTRITESMKELDDIQNAISTLKLEQEQHKGSISKLDVGKKKNSG